MHFFIFQSKILPRSYIADFSAITFHAYGREIRVHGFSTLFSCFCYFCNLNRQDTTLLVLHIKQ